MTYTEWAYNTPVGDQSNPAQLVTTNWADISAQLDGQHAQGAGSTAETLNALGVFPTTRIGDLPDQWHMRDEANDSFAYVAGDGGQLYQITQAWREMTYEEARRHARDILEDYYQRYSQSYFTIAGKWFAADAEQQCRYLRLDAFVKDDVAAANPISYVVFDVAADANRFTSEGEWNSFFRKWKALDTEAQDKADAAWTAVKGATTTAEVKTIIDGLDPIPEPV